MTSVAGIVVGVGALATKMALDYEDAFVRISAVSNASQRDIEKWHDQVLDLAGATAQAPQELADALFFLASAGLKSSQIMPVLTASAKASAVGLGETADVAKLTANVLNAYAGTGLEAARVTDILVAAVREGSADTDEFGTAIGRILPIASAAGVGFDNVAASLAALSNVGLDVNEGVTAMRGLLQALVSPTSAAAEAMKSVGLSAQELLVSLQEDGLIGTLRLLDARVKAQTNSQAEYMGVMRELVPNVRSLTGVLGLTQQEASRVDAVFRRVSHSTGDLGKAFDETASGPGFKLRKALAQLQSELVKLGDIILPVVVKVVEGARKELQAWGDMFSTVGQKVSEWGRKIGDAFHDMGEDVKNLVSTIKSVFFGVPDFLTNVGKNMILGLWHGMQSMFSTVWEGVTNFVSSITDKITGVLGIHSPSKVFEDIGRNMMAGMDKGIQAGSVDVVGSLSGITGAMNVGLPQGAISGDVILQIDGREFARVSRDQLLKLGSRNAGTKIT
jgi:TP901 family phage tail tape measure protein